MDGQNSAPSAVGPLSHSVPSLRLAVKAILSQEPWNHDPNVICMPWRQELETEVVENAHNGGLAFAYFKNDAQVTPWPPVQRAMDDVLERIRKAGHKVRLLNSLVMDQRANVCARVGHRMGRKLT